ncbi:MAG: hypothetical protein Q9226_008783 [Calogaya cf. arnoldii]
MAPNIPEKQWAMIIEKTGGPVDYKEIPVPKPGPDEVLVNIKYSGVCHTDLHAVNGDWPLATKLPLVGGHEGAGVVVARGDLVKDVEIGDHAGIKVPMTIPVHTIASNRRPSRRSGSTDPASPVASACKAMNPFAPKLFSPAILSTALSSNTPSAKLPMSPVYPKKSLLTALPPCSALVSPSTKV